MKQRSRNSKQIRRRNEIALRDRKNRHGGACPEQPNTQVELRHERRNATGCGSASTSARRAASVTSTFAGARTCRTTLRHDVCHRTLCCEARRNRCGRAREQQKGQERPQHNARRRGRMRSLEESRGIAHTRRIKDKTMKTLAIEPREIACDPVGHPGQRTRIALS